MSHPRTTRLLLTIDVERDYTADWATPDRLSFTSVCRALPELLAPLCAQTGMRPTYFVSPETLCDPDAVATLRAQTDCELAAHLHADYMPGVLTAAQWTDPRTSIRWMQKDLGPDGEAHALAELTELFAQQLGQRPRSFRAGRFGISKHTGRILSRLGYRSDSSVTPGIVWTDPAGARQPDFRGLPHHPYRVHASGNIWQQASSIADASPLLELPVTVVPGHVIGNADPAPVWLRPWKNTRAEMLAILDAAARDEDAGHGWGALCIMFHSMELVAGASPYPQTEADVQRFVADLGAVAKRAQQLGFAGRTVTEFEAEFSRSEDARAKQTAAVRRITPEQWHIEAPGAERWQVHYVTPAGDPVDVETILERHGVQPWFAYSLRARAERWDNALAYAWLREHLPTDAAVLDVGCGVGVNLQWLAQRGFQDLSGCDLDAKAVAAGRELAAATGTPFTLWVDDGRTLTGAPTRRFDAVLAMNWIQLVEPFDMPAFLRRVDQLLSDRGVLIFDYIDRDYDRHENHAWLTSDWGKPEADREPSEYRTRYGAAEIRHDLARHGFCVAQETRNDSPIPKGVLCCRRAGRPEPAVPPSLLPSVVPNRTAMLPELRTRPTVLYVVDAPGWAHDHKSRNLIHCLAPRFDGRVVYQQDVTADDLDRADLIVIWYWRQLQSMAAISHQLGATMARNRHKLLMGVCSHNELEAEHRTPGLSVLQQLPAHVFTHSALLEAEVRPLLPGTEPWCLPNGVDASLFTPGSERHASADRPLRVGWAGSLDNFGPDMRGVTTVIEPAIAELQAQHPGSFELVIAAREQQLRTHAQMRDFYRSIDVYVCASRVEGTPNPALEAAACGVPVVSTRVGNMPELIEHGVTGLLIERQPKKLAAALLLLQQRPDLRTNMGRRLRATIEQAWDWPLRAQGFARLFDETLVTASHDASSIRTHLSTPVAGGSL